jgi:hypothetical protein
MSPKPTIIEQIKRGAATAAVIAGGVIAVTALVRPSLVYIDGRYVHEQDYSQQRKLDSLALIRKLDDIRRTTASIDTGVRCLRGALPRRDCEK